MKKRLRENIEIGDEVFVPKDEYHVTVLDIMDDMALVDGPMGKEYYNLKDLEKSSSGYGERYLNESRKKVIRLTESDLTRIVKRVIKESEIWSDEEVADFMNNVINTELGRDNLNFESMDQDKQIRFVSKYINMTADEDVIHNLKRWALNKINTQDID